MTFSGEAVEAAARALHRERYPWVSWENLKPESREYYRNEVRVPLEAALPHLTDDGAGSGEPAVAAGEAGSIPAGNPAPSSPHLEDWTEEERGFVEIALSAADSGNAGHWPTVATYLAAEVRRLRAGEGATPAIDREALHAQLIERLADLPYNEDARRLGYSNRARIADAVMDILA